MTFKWCFFGAAITKMLTIVLTIYAFLELNGLVQTTCSGSVCNNLVWSTTEISPYGQFLIAHFGLTGTLVFETAFLTLVTIGGFVYASILWENPIQKLLGHTMNMDRVMPVFGMTMMVGLALAMIDMTIDFSQVVHVLA